MQSIVWGMDRMGTSECSSECTFNNADLIAQEILAWETQLIQASWGQVFAEESTKFWCLLSALTSKGKLSLRSKEVFSRWKQNSVFLEIKIEKYGY